MSSPTQEKEIRPSSLELSIAGIATNSSKMIREPGVHHQMTEDNIKASIAGEPTNTSKMRPDPRWAESTSTIPPGYGLERIYSGKSRK